MILIKDMIRWLKYDNTTLRCKPSHNKDYSMIQKMRKQGSSYMYWLLYTDASRLRLSIPGTGTVWVIKLKLADGLDYTNNVAVLSHMLSRNRL